MHLCLRMHLLLLLHLLLLSLLLINHRSRVAIVVDLVVVEGLLQNAIAIELLQKQLRLHMLSNHLVWIWLRVAHRLELLLVVRVYLGV